MLAIPLPPQIRTQTPVHGHHGTTNQAALKTAAEAGSNIWVKVQWKNGDTAKFQAAISGYALVGGSNEDGVKAKISMRINGDVAFTDAS